MKIGFIAGSGLVEGLEQVLTNVTPIENHENKMGVVPIFYKGIHNSSGTEVVIIPRHGPKGDRTPATLVRERGYEANVWQFHKEGVEAVFGFTAVGALDGYIELADSGVFIVPEKYMRGFAASQHSFGKDALTWFPNMGQPFDPELREIAIDAIEKAGYDAIESGLYIYNGGDTFETPTEITVLDKLTKDFRNRVVGMTTGPELALLKQVNIPLVAIASNVNYAQGLSDATPVSHEQTLKVMEQAAKYINNIVQNILISYDKQQ